MNSFSNHIAVVAALSCLSLSANLTAAEFVVDKAKSKIEVDVKSSVHDFTGRLTDYKIKITGDASKAEPSKVDLTWDFKHLKTGDAKRDTEMLHWMEHAKLPSGKFTLSSFTKRVDGNMWAKGTLTIHGVSKVVQFPVQSKRSGRTLQVVGQVSIDHRNFKLEKIRKVLVLTVDPVVSVKFSLQGTIK